MLLMLMVKLVELDFEMTKMDAKCYITFVTTSITFFHKKYHVITEN